MAKVLLGIWLVFLASCTAPQSVSFVPQQGDADSSAEADSDLVDEAEANGEREAEPERERDVEPGEADRDYADNDFSDADYDQRDSDFFDYDQADSEREGRETSEDEDAEVLPSAMIHFAEGEFWMGCNEAVDNECLADERPYHRVLLAAFALDATEVTVAQYRACVRAGRCTTEGLDTDSDETGVQWACNWTRQAAEDQPINCLTFEQATRYCEWQSKRLPTEAEWERAARGPDGRKYSWGNTGFIASATAWANIADATLGAAKGAQFPWALASYDDGYASTAPVGSYPNGATPEGALDMIGNVWEWTSDWYDAAYYAVAPLHDPQGPGAGQTRVVRGGSWGSGPDWARASVRGKFAPNERDAGTGLRCAR